MTLIDIQKALKKRLIESEIICGQLIVSFDGDEYIFNNPESVQDWIESGQFGKTTRKLRTAPL
jgi:hypothetical protein